MKACTSENIFVTYHIVVRIFISNGITNASIIPATATTTIVATLNVPVIARNRIMIPQTPNVAITAIAIVFALLEDCPAGIINVVPVLGDTVAPFTITNL